MKNLSAIEKRQPAQGEIVLYQPDETISLEVQLENDTVWLTQQQMAELFETTKNNITLHIGNVYKERELLPGPTSKESLLVRMEGNRQVTRKRNLYNLDVIISVGYRVKSKRGTQFRQWANLVIKDYLLRGYAINQQYPPITVNVCQRNHDRFLIIDDEVYAFGASLKDAGKKLFAYIKMNETPAADLLSRIR